MIKFFLASITVAFSATCLPGVAAGQTMEDGASSTFEAPFGMRDVSETDSIVTGSRDASLNKVVTSTAGWGFSSSAIGNLVNVVTQGSNNTVVINTSQITSGSQQSILASPTGHSREQGSSGLDNLATIGAPSFQTSR